MIDLSHTEYESSDCATVQGPHQSLPTLPTTPMSSECYESTNFSSYLPLNPKSIPPLHFSCSAPFPTLCHSFDFFTANSSPSPILFTEFRSDSLFSGSPRPSTMTHHFQPIGKSLSSGSQGPAQQLQPLALSSSSPGPSTTTYHPQPQTSKRVAGRPPKLPKNVTKAEKKAGQRRVSKPSTSKPKAIYVVTPKQRLSSDLEEQPAKKKPRLVSKLGTSNPEVIHVDTPKQRLSSDREEQPAKKKPRLVSKLGTSNPEVIHVDTPKQRLSSDLLEEQPDKKKPRLSPLQTTPQTQIPPRHHIPAGSSVGSRPQTLHCALSASTVPPVGSLPSTTPQKVQQYPISSSTSKRLLTSTASTLTAPFTKSGGQAQPMVTTIGGDSCSRKPQYNRSMTYVVSTNPSASQFPDVATASIPTSPGVSAQQLPLPSTSPASLSRTGAQASPIYNTPASVPCSPVGAPAKPSPPAGRTISAPLPFVRAAPQPPSPQLFRFSAVHGTSASSLQNVGGVGGGPPEVLRSASGGSSNAAWINSPDAASNLSSPSLGFTGK